MNAELDILRYTLDTHSYGAEMITVARANAGFEMIYGGIRRYKNSKGPFR